MIQWVSLTLVVVCLLFSRSCFADVVLVSPSSGGEGIQLALDSLPDGGEVALSEGRYLIRAPIVLRKDHQTLRGRGVSTVLYLVDDANCPVVIIGSPIAPAKEPVKDVRLADLLIDGNRANQQQEVWRLLSDGAGVYNNGVDVWGTDQATVEHVVCCHCRSGGMVATAGTRRLAVRDFTAFDNQFDGLACYLTEDSDFSHLNLHNNLSAGISLDLDFNHNVIRDAVLTGNDLGVFMRQSRSNVFEALTIRESRHHGVFMAQTFSETAAGCRPCPGSECAGNSFFNILISHCGGEAFVVNDASCADNVICSGQFTDNAQAKLPQASPTLVATKNLPLEDKSPRSDTVITSVHQLTGHLPEIQNEPQSPVVY